jgi:hypothetical protein
MVTLRTSEYLMLRKSEYTSSLNNQKADQFILFATCCHADHVDGVRLSLNCGHKRADCSPPGDIHMESHGSMISRGKLLIRPPELSSNPTSSNLVGNRRNGRNKLFMPCAVFLFILSK